MPDLDLYCRDCVIGGRGAFLVVAQDFEHFATLAVSHGISLEEAMSAASLAISRAMSDNNTSPSDPGAHDVCGIGLGAIARVYREHLAGAPVTVPPEMDPGHVYHLFPVRSPRRDALQRHLLARGIETLVHYPIPIPRQAALSGETPAQCPVADRVCDELLSLPMYPALTLEAAREVAGAVRQFEA